MASLLMHMAVGEVYLKYYQVADKESFMRGVQEPDLIGRQGYREKGLSHFSEILDQSLETSIEIAKRTKVNLYNYLHAREINSDFELGYFLHLVTDYYFFNYVIDASDFHNDVTEYKRIYADYGKLAKAIKDKYSVDNSNNPWDNCYLDGEPEILTLEGACDFIEQCGKIDLYELREAVLASTPDNWRENIEKFYIQ